MGKIGNCGHICKNNWKNEVYLKKIGENTKNKKFEDLFTLVMKICRKIQIVKV